MAAKVKPTLHTARDAKTIMKLLEEGGDVSKRDENGDAPIHAIVGRKESKEKLDCLMALLVHSDSSDLDINITTVDDITALHITVKQSDMACVKALLAFGADINHLDAFKQSPLDIALHQDNVAMIDFLAPLGAFLGEYVCELRQSFVQEKVPVAKKLEETDSNDPNIPGGATPFMSVKLKEYQGGKLRLELQSAAVRCIQEKLVMSPMTSLKGDALAALVQLREFQKAGIPMQVPDPTGLTPPIFNVDSGERVLCLDGGGIKGLVQIEVLMQMEQLTGRKITELFNWIVGTSTGGIIALAMVYAKKTLPELRKLYFELKDKVFSSTGKSGYGCDTQELEKVLKKYLGTTTRLTDVDTPNVLITAVDCRDTKLELKFFNNCFYDNYSNELLWKVARYTSAAPVYFEPLDNYVDGGIRANNPTAYALTKIQRSLDGHAAASKGPKPKYACVVSVGCGVYPPEKIGDFSIQKICNMWFGKQVLNLKKLRQEVQNLIKLLATAVTESEGVADNCRSRCEKQNIPFYRFSPELDDVISLSETDNEKLCGIILKTKGLLQSVDTQVDELVQMFYHLFDCSRKFEEDGKPKF